MNWLNYLVLGLYVLMMAAIAVYTRKSSKTTGDFLLAGRGVGGWMSAFAYGTTYFSAVIFIGYAGKFGWNFGLAAVWVGIGNAVIGSLLAWKVLARRTRNITNKLQATTMPEFFGKRYSDNRLKFFSALLIFVFLIPYSASVYQGLASIFETVFHIDFAWCVIVMALLTAIYVFVGGYTATAISNFIQGIIMIAGVAVMVVILLSRPEIDFAKLANDNLGLIPQGGSTLLKAEWFNVLIIVFLTSFGVWGLPQVIHKFYAVKNEFAIKRAIIVSTIFCLIVGGCAYFVGSLLHLFISPEQAALEFTKNGKLQYDMLVPAILSKYLPAGLIGLIVVLLLSASMSTLSSLALSGSSSIAVDLYKGYINKDAEDKKVKFYLRVFCFIYIAVSAFLALAKIDAIVTMMSLSWGTLAGCFMGPYIYGIYSKKVTPAAAWASLISGVALTVILVTVFGLNYPDKDFTGIMAVIKGGIQYSPLIGVCAMAFSMIITPLVSLFTKKQDSTAVDEMFKGINEKLK